MHTWVLQHQARRLRIAMLAISRWGDWPSHVIAGLIAVGVAYALRWRTAMRIFLAMIVACAVAGAAARVIKVAAGRARPSVHADAAWRGPSTSSKFHAFPSGHTASSAAFFAVPLFARRRLALAFLPIPILIATSRVLLEAHYLSDVIFATILGVFCALLVWRFGFATAASYQSGRSPRA